MACSGSVEFSNDGRYLSACGQDGKLKIWETETGLLKQEYTPNLHLVSPCTCLTWISLQRPSVSSKKKRRSKSSLESAEKNVSVIAMGTTAGNVLLYSIAVGDVEAQLQGGHSGSVTCLSWSSGSHLYSGGADAHVTEWAINDGSVKSKWKAGTEQLTSILVLPDGKSLLAASRTISWWNLDDKQVIKTFAGHSTDVLNLIYVAPVTEHSENYFLSSAKGDRYVSAWSLNPSNRNKTPVASFVMEDIAVSVTVFSSSETQQITLGTVTRSGVLHLYRHQLNGKCQKPLKPKVTVQIASDTGQNKETVTPIPIIGAHLCDESTVLIAHGNMVFLTFEKIVPNCYEKVLCLVRKDPRQPAVTKEESSLKVKIPETEGNVQYMQAPATTPAKRSRRVQSEVPMEERLENLQLKEPEQNRTAPRGDSLAHLLVQALHSKDKKMLHSALFRNEDKIINNTVQRLPLQAVAPLVKELATLLHGRPHVSQLAAKWLKAVVSAHASQLLANPDLSDTLSPVLGLVEARLNVLAPLSRLRGRLDLLMDQIVVENAAEGERSVAQEESLLVYQDTDSSEEMSAEDDGLNSDSDHWEELSEDLNAVGDSEVQEEEMEVTEMSS
ncbi:WD repeat-containing protein 43 isoform X2 [Schistocerca serialis cubense]|uniref:WD repeat-containing protein 43 isoform X2 n=1 Tax=Schistocerca serialis cubense TaxID=2023355 RepID=UPI00214E1284|nr:WD repeat-containing protein 43 isoform X2 [Schistocerca serialis cubense]